MAVTAQAAGTTGEQRQTLDIDFYFDPVCPWAWRTSLWIREVAQVRPINIHWKFLSLEYINSTREGGHVRDSHRTARDGFKLMTLARREFGDQAVDKLYLALGRARHERQENIGERAVLLRALEEAGLDQGLLDRALADESLVTEFEQEQKTIDGLGGFGVATIVIEGHDPLFGPVINPVPKGEEAGEMWDHFEYFLRRPDFFELKRAIRR